MTLPRILLKSLGHSFYWAVPGRLFLILFQYGPPLLIKETIRFVSLPPGSRRFTPGAAYILAVSAIVYVGHAVRINPESPPQPT